MLLWTAHTSPRRVGWERSEPGARAWWMRVEVMISGAHPGGLEGSGSELFSQLGTGRVTF